MLSILIVIVFVFLICFVFLCGGSMPLKTASSSQGMVLGVSEAAAGSSLDQLINSYNNLPDSGDSVLLPKRKEIAEKIFFAISAGVVLDNKSQALLFNQEADKVVSIASITKLITALVFLDCNPGWETIYQVKPQDRVEGGRIYLYNGEKIKIKDLFYLSLVGSANTATKGLVNSTGLSEEEFIIKMNAKAKELGLEKTSFVDPIGLSNANISTALEVAKLAQIALSNKDISAATLTKKYEFSTLTGKKKVVNNTDVLLDIFPQNGVQILGGKTGFIDLAGYCFVGKFINKQGHEIVSVVLGAESNKDRFSQTKRLVEWIYNSYVW